MGLHINIAVTLHELFEALAAQGSVLTLGVQDIGFTRRAFNLAAGQRLQPDDEAATPNEFFAACGFSALQSLDVSDFEGADHVFDLNDDRLPHDLIERYDCVLNGGTLEHVFHLPNALSSITRMLRPRGLVVHVVPVHNWVDHGFYQISPILLHRYYTAACFEILESRALLFSADQGDSRIWEIFPCPVGAFAEGLCGTLDSRAMLCVFVARKTEHSTGDVRPVQPMYDAPDTVQPVRTNTPAWFLPYRLLEGQREREGIPLRIAIGPFTHQGGNCWSCNLPAEVPLGDDVNAHIRSRLALFEDGKLQTPAHSAHSRIKSMGRGAYSHWRRELYLSASDNSDPNSNGRDYYVIVPADHQT
ncbi:hypothetical protein [Bradyrhizobium sp. LHD-71]|uniref:hypothetical protein n=1 Tax=Bradyrhizobium sp. LHD-71 TaxID=3072141 RepID=UPI00280F8D69|nr:hypothetical protein [Bradyrhizobium sp. LHD-71]MDQ8728348.1 hypothetical protein [Bradyrhizobium sp. LHD-71]